MEMVSLITRILFHLFLGFTVKLEWSFQKCLSKFSENCSLLSLPPFENLAPRVTSSTKLQYVEKELRLCWDRVGKILKSLSSLKSQSTFLSRKSSPIRLTGNPLRLYSLSDSWWKMCIFAHPIEFCEICYNKFISGATRLSPIMMKAAFKWLLNKP